MARWVQVYAQCRRWLSGIFISESWMLLLIPALFILLLLLELWLLVFGFYGVV